MAEEKKPAKAESPPRQLSPEEKTATREAVEDARRAHEPEPDPRGVALQRVKDPDGKDQGGPPQPPEAEALPVPRAVHQNYRAPAGLFRFKVRAPRHSAPGLYILARDEAEARRCYLSHTRLDQAIEDAKAMGLQPDVPALYCKRLPD